MKYTSPFCPGINDYTLVPWCISDMICDNFMNGKFILCIGSSWQPSILEEGDGDDDDDDDGVAADDDGDDDNGDANDDNINNYQQ